jgi:hypothetical protein
LGRRAASLHIAWGRAGDAKCGVGFGFPQCAELNQDRREIATAQLFDQTDRIAPVSLHPFARLLQNERGRHHHALRHTGDEADCLMLLVLDFLDDFLKAGYGFSEVLCASIRASDLLDTVALIEGLGGFNNGRRGLVATRGPLVGVEDLLLGRLR